MTIAIQLVLKFDGKPDLCSIPDLYAELPALYSDICVLSSTVPETYVSGGP